MQKRCGKCGEQRPLEGFHKDSSRTDGLAPYCKACVIQYARDYRKAHPELRKAWNEANADRRREYRNRWKAAHPDHYRIWNETKGSFTRSKNRARNAGVVNTLEIDVWQALCDWFGGVCLCCGRKEQLTVDHVVSMKQGGANDILNVQPLCRHCNISKGPKHTDYRDPAKFSAFLQSIEYKEAPRD